MQDLAMQCVRRILDVSLYRQSERVAFFSDETPQRRREIAAEVRAWWAKQGSKGPLATYLSKLQEADLRERIWMLDKIEEIDRRAVDAVALLRRWAAHAKPADFGHILLALEARKDLSLLPAVRKLVRDDKAYLTRETVRFLFDHATPEDVRFFADTVRSFIRSGERYSTSVPYWAIAGAASDARHELAVPVLVAMLADRTQSVHTGASHGDGDDRIPAAPPAEDEWIPPAEFAAHRLMNITDRSFGYWPYADQKSRTAAVKRWMAWWEKEGRAAYVQEHPGVAPLLGPPAPARKH